MAYKLRKNKEDFANKIANQDPDILERKFNESSLWEIYEFFTTLERGSEVIAKSIAERHQNTLSKAFKEKANESTLFYVEAFLSSINDSSEDVAKAIIQAHSDILFEIFEKDIKNTSTRKLVGYLSTIATISKEVSVELAKTHKNYLADQIKEYIQVGPEYDDWSFLRDLAFTSRDVTKEIIWFCRKELGGQLPKIFSLNRFTFSDRGQAFVIKEIMKFHKNSFFNLIRQKFQELSFFTITLLLLSFKSISRPLSKEILEDNKPVLMERVTKHLNTYARRGHFFSSDLRDLSNFFYHSYSISEELTREIFQPHQSKISQQFDEFLRSASGRGIGQFLSYMAAISFNFALELVETYKDLLDERLLELELPDILDILYDYSTGTDELKRQILLEHRKTIFNKFDETLEHLSLQNVYMFIYMVGIRTPEIGEEFVEEYYERIVQIFEENISTENLQLTTHLLSCLAKASKSHAQRLVQNHKNALINAIRENSQRYSLLVNGMILLNIAEAAQSAAEEITQALKDILIQLFLEQCRSDFLGISYFLSGIVKASPSIAKDLIENHKDSLIENVYLAFLKKRSRGIPYLFKMGSFILDVSNVAPKMAKEIVQLYKIAIIDNFRIVLERSSNLLLFESFISGIAKTSEDLAKDLIYKNQDLLKEYLENLSQKEFDALYSEVAKGAESIAESLAQIYEQVKI